MRIFLIILLLVIGNNTFAQCESNTETDDCSTGIGPLVHDADLTSGDKYWWSESTGNRSNIEFHGGRLVVCGGELIINSLNINDGGTIIVMGGELTFNCDYVYLNGGFTIVNYGTIRFNNLTLQGNPQNRIFNHSSGEIDVSGQTTINGNSGIINSGYFHSNDLLIQSSQVPAICQNEGAIFEVSNNFTNNTENSFQSVSGESTCMSIGKQIQLNEIISNDPSLEICLSSGVSYNGGNSSYWGDAYVMEDCPSCAVALPISLQSFEAENIQNKHIRINWITASEVNNDYFTIERSKDGRNWETLTTISGAGNSTQLIEYQYIDEEPLNGVSYYRLKQTDFNGSYEYFKPGAVSFSTEETKLLMYPNPTRNTLVITGYKLIEEPLRVFNSLGQDVTSDVQIINSKQDKNELDLTALPKAVYCIKIGNIGKLVHKE